MNSNPQNFIVTALLAAGLLGAETRAYQIAPAEGSRFTLEVYKTGLMSGKKHVFLFERYSGEAAFDEQKPEDAKIRFAVEAGSVVCTDTWINQGSRKKVQATARNEMMQADKYPELLFISAKVAAKGENQYDVEGMLTIRGVAKPVVVHVSRKGGVFEGNARLRLSDFGLKAPSSGLSLGLIGTKNEMSVLFLLKAK